MQPTPGKAVFVRALVILNFDINCHFYTRHISVQNIGYRSSWSVIIGIGIGPEKRISVDPYFLTSAGDRPSAWLLGGVGSFCAGV